MFRRKIPFLLRLQKAGLGGGHNNGEANERAEQGWEFRAQRVGNNEVGNSHRQRGEYGEGPNAQSLGEGFIFAKEPRHDRNDQ